MIRPQAAVNLGQFILTLCLRSPNGTVTPLPDHLFWFGDEQVEPPYWVFIYTCAGQRRLTSLASSGDALKEPALVLHWGKENTVLQDASIEPVVFQLGSLLRERQPSFFGMVETRICL